jgi:hypothetical protein
MALKDKLTEEFLLSLKEVEPLLLTLQFKPYSYLEKGGHYIKYKKENTGSVVEFLFGPSGWEIEMIIFTSKGKFAFKDLFVIPVIAKWLNENRYKEESGRDIRNEMLYCIEVLKVSLPIIE